jgi:aspartate racemase
MKTLGIIGGVGPESTIDYYRTIIALYRDRKGDGSYPQFIINSIDLNKEMGFVFANDPRSLVEMLVDEIRKLAGAGADFGLIASNTPHLAFDEIQARSSLPLISIVEVTCTAAKAGKLKRLAIFGTSFTMRGSFYPKVFNREGIEVIVPAADDLAYVHDKYWNELVPGKFLPETHAGLLAVVDRMKANANIDGVILAGTELPLILREPDHHGIPFLNTTAIHCQAAVGEMLK